MGHHKVKLYNLEVHRSLVDLFKSKIQICQPFKENLVENEDVYATYHYKQFSGFKSCKSKHAGKTAHQIRLTKSKIYGVKNRKAPHRSKKLQLESILMS